MAFQQAGVLDRPWGAGNGDFTPNSPMAAGGFSPSMLSGLEAFYDLKDSSGYTTATGVKLLYDKSGNSGVNVLALNGVAGNYASAPDSVPLSITGDLDVRVDCSAVDWTPSGFQNILGKYVDATSGGYGLGLVATTGVIQLYWSTGAGAVSANSTVAPTVSDLGRIWIRATLDVDNGAAGYTVTFYTSQTGTSWTQLGAPVVGGAPTSIGDGAIALNLGTNNNGVGAFFIGNIYRAQIYAGLTGSDLRFDANFALASKLATSFSESSSNAATVTINSTGDLGARIQGARDLYQFTTTKQPPLLTHSGTNYGWTNGAVANFFSAPDSVPLSITGDLDIRAFIYASDYTPATAMAIIGKWNATGNQLSYLFRIDTDGKLRLYHSADGSASPSAASTVSLTTVVSDGAGIWVRATFDVDDGAGNHVKTFYYSSDGSSWSLLGTAVTTAGATSIFNSTADVTVGQANASNPFVGSIYRAQIYDGIAGTLAFDFNPATYVSGTTFADSSSNAATITLNGGATIVTRTIAYFDGTDDYMKAPAFSLAQPTTVYFVGQQVSWFGGDNIFDGSGASNRNAFFQSGVTPATLIFAGSSVASNTDFTVATNRVATLVFNGASSSSRINRLTAVTANAGVQASNGFTLGSQNDGSNPSNINVLGILIFSTAHDTATQNRVALFLSRYYGLAGV